MIRRYLFSLFLLAGIIVLFYKPVIKKEALLFHPYEDNSEPFIRKGFINRPVKGLKVHVASLAEINGNFHAVWYGGREEGTPDTAIYTSERIGNSRVWRDPVKLLTREKAAEELGMYVKKIGNPLIFAGMDNNAHLLYVSVSAGGWAGSSINYRLMDKSMQRVVQKSRKLFLSPLFNVSELVRNRPLVMGKTFIVPVYHECIGNFSEILFLNSDQDRLSYRKKRITHGREWIQPSFVFFNENEGAAFLRTYKSDSNLYLSLTEDGGESWSSPLKTSLPSSGSGINALSMGGDSVLLCYNHCTESRESLDLAFSPDRGRTWEHVCNLEKEKGEEFSYPYMVRGRDGNIHLVYTWKRKRIRYLVFNNARVRRALRRDKNR